MDVRGSSAQQWRGQSREQPTRPPTQQPTEGSGPLPRGLLGLPGRLPFSIGRSAPTDDLAWLVAHFWESRWDVPPGRRVTARVLPHPNVNLTVEGEDDHLVLTGIAPGVYHRELTGRGDVLGVKFTVGAFGLLSGTPVQSLSGRGTLAETLLPGGTALAEAVRGVDRDGQRQVIEDYLRGLELHAPEELVMVRRAAEALLRDPSVSRVSEAAAAAGVSERTLQRLFTGWVGVSPGWVLRRGRLHAAAERVIQVAAVGPGGDSFADVAAEYGYADQAHFTNDFRRVLGEPPATWAAHLVSESAV